MCYAAVIVPAVKAVAGFAVKYAAVAATAYSVYSSVQQSKQNAEAQKGTAEYNTRVAENDAQRSRNIANEKENALRLKNARLLSKQRAQLGAANIDLSSGSALQLQEDTINLGEADALRIRRTGDSQFSGLMQESELETAKGDLAESQGRFNIAGSLLSGAGDFMDTGVADKWFTPKSAGNNNPLNLRAGQGL